MTAIWLDGRLVAAAEARVALLDHGFTVGDGVFETLEVLPRDGRRQAFALGRHLDRLRRSAAGIGLTLDRDDAELRRAVDEVLAAAPDAGRLRITVTAGAGPPGSERGDGPLTVALVATPAAARPPHARVATVSWRRNEHGALVGLKTTSYGENVVALRAAHEAGADEAILANTAGELCEGTGSNVFVVIDGEVRTPPLTSGCLAGITRALVLDVAGPAGIDIDADTPLAFTALADADEVFLTSSTRGVQPVAAVDGVAPARCPGPRTAALARAFDARRAAEIDP